MGRIRFGSFELDSGAFELRRAGNAVRLEPIPLELLIFLVERRGQLVSREEILERIWGKEVFVDADNSINTAIRKIRGALREDPENPQFVHTVPGKGYRFTTDVRATEEEPARPTTQTTPALHNKSLQWLVPLSLVLAVSVLAVLGIPRLFNKEISGSQGKTMLVVLPFVNMSGDPQQEYFADGITEEVITRLGGLDPQKLGVIARTSSMQYRGTRKDAAQIARELHVGYLLEGSVRRERDRIRIAAQLIQASDQTHLWAGNFEGQEGDVLKLQGDLALAISSKIALTLPEPVRARLAETQPVNSDAYQAYLAGQQALETRTRPGALRSIAEFQHSISLDSNYAPAYAGLATTYSLASVLGVMEPREALPKAKEAALRAIALDDSLAAGHTELAFYLAHYEFDWPAAEREYRRALELNPNDPRAHFFFSNSFLSPMGRHAEAIAEMRRAIELDPFSPAVQSFFGTTLVWAGKYDEAVEQHQKCGELFPGLAIERERLAHVYTYLGRFDEAITEDTRAKILVGITPEVATQQEQAQRKALATDGPAGYWRKLLEYAQLPGNPPETYATPQQLALIHTRLGEKEQALTLLEKAYSERGLGLTELAVEPAFQPLHSEPRFQNLLNRIGLRVTNRIEVAPR